MEGREREGEGRRKRGREGGGREKRGDGEGGGERGGEREGGLKVTRLPAIPCNNFHYNLSLSITITKEIVTFQYAN